MNQPLVSILMSAYNRQQYIAEAIESVLASTYGNWELIIVDDGSKDNTVAIAQSYAAKDERIRLYVNENNLGDYPIALFRDSRNSTEQIFSFREPRNEAKKIILHFESHETG